MAWISAIAAVGGSALSAYGQGQAADQQGKQTKEQYEFERTSDRENAQFNADTAYYYSQLKRQDEQRGLDQFRTMSSVKNYDPNFVDNNPRVVVPDKPIFNQGIYAPPSQPPKGEGSHTLGEFFDPMGVFTGHSILGNLF